MNCIIQHLIHLRQESGLGAILAARLRHVVRDPAPGMVQLVCDALRWFFRELPPFLALASLRLLADARPTSRRMQGEPGRCRFGCMLWAGTTWSIAPVARAHSWAMACCASTGARRQCVRRTRGVAHLRRAGICVLRVALHFIHFTLRSPAAQESANRVRVRGVGSSGPAMGFGQGPQAPRAFSVRSTA